MIDFSLYEEELIKLRREFHQIPELGYNEFKTSKKIKEYLKEYGITDIKEYMDTGVCATIYGKGNKTIGIRADIDALPVFEETNLPYKSLHDGFMHACGHDGHIAMALIVAKIFCENKEELNGNLKIIFQPCEEGDGGAKIMIEEGVLKSPDVDYMISGHLWPDIETGKVDITKGITFARSDIIKITVNGIGGHGALPHNVKDSLYVGSKIVVALKELNKKYNENNKKVILSICSFDCKSIYNIFRDNAYIEGTLRTVDDITREEITKDIEETVKKILNEENIDGNCKITLDFPALRNDLKLSDILKPTIENTIGKENLIDFGPVMGAEDFSYFSNEVPSIHYKIGSKNGDSPYNLHNSKYELNESSLLVGIKVFYNSIKKLFKI